MGGKSGRHTLWTPALQETVCQYIRAGAFDYVAAQAVGISINCFYKWMTGKKPPFSDFAIAVRQAKAQARMTAEIAIKKERPEVWLMKGPGRDRPGEPGWSDKQEIQLTGTLALTAGADLTGLDDEELDWLERIGTKAFPRGLPSDTEGEGEEIAGEVVSVGEPGIPDPEPPAAVDRNAGTGGEGGSQATADFHAPATWEIVDDNDLLPSVVPGPETEPHGNP